MYVIEYANVDWICVAENCILLASSCWYCHERSGFLWRVTFSWPAKWLLNSHELCFRAFSKDTGCAGSVFPDSIKPLLRGSLKFYFNNSEPRRKNFLLPLRRPRLKCDGARAETRFRLSAKRTSPFQSAGGVSSVDCWQPRCAHRR
jgi:hypothetical protein